MAKILQFPSRQLQGLAFLESQIRDMMSARGADTELMDFAAATLRSIYQRSAAAENYRFSLALPESISNSDADILQASIHDGIEKICAGNHAIIVRLIAELVLAEVRNFQHSRDDIN